MTLPRTYGDLLPRLLASGAARVSESALTREKMRRAVRALPRDHYGRSIVEQVRDSQRVINDAVRYGTGTTRDGVHIANARYYASIARAFDNRRPGPMIINVSIREIANGLLLDFNGDYLGAPAWPEPTFYADYPALYAELPTKIAEHHERLTTAKTRYDLCERAATQGEEERVFEEQCAEDARDAGVDLAGEARPKPEPGYVIGGDMLDQGRQQEP